MLPYIFIQESKSDVLYVHMCNFCYVTNKIIEELDNNNMWLSELKKAYFAQLQIFMKYSIEYISRRKGHPCTQFTINV